ncbi:MAG: biotin--[acetyl-CoA-carboxylase] ligase [Firmicutes bacterium]|nr:biotin--[acetyl-CoA-carboxylase] ligase [Bacillota bacterium]
MNKKDLDRIRTYVEGDFFYYDSVGSTNTEAMRHTDAKDKSLFIAEKQTNGRGRKNRSWEASSGGIYMTILLKPEKISGDISALTLAAGLAAARAIPDAMIKWPNDIILGEKKVAGILTETRIFGESCVIAVGIGINANNKAFSEDLEDKATSIYLYSGNVQDKASLISKVYCEFLELYEDFKSGFSKIREEYSKKCITLNREIMVISDGKERVMYASSINEKGELLVVSDGKTEVINSGEVSVRGLLGYAK